MVQLHSEVIWVTDRYWSNMERNTYTQGLESIMRINPKGITNLSSKIITIKVFTKNTTKK